MTNQSDDIEDLKEEMEEIVYRLERVEHFLSSFEAGSSVPPILDERFNEVIELLKNEEKITVSMLQRHLDIGFAKASRIIDQLEFMGFISPPGNPANPREVYQDKIRAYLEEIQLED